MPRELKPIAHGTAAGYRLELHRKLPTCKRCRAAWVDASREINQRYKATQAGKAAGVRAQVKSMRFRNRALIRLRAAHLKEYQKYYAEEKALDEQRRNK